MCTNKIAIRFTGCIFTNVPYNAIIRDVMALTNVCQVHTPKVHLYNVTLRDLKSFYNKTSAPSHIKFGEFVEKS